MKNCCEGGRSDLECGSSSSVTSQSHNNGGVREIWVDESETRMWANAKRDGRPAEYRCRSLFNAAKFG